MIAKIGNALSVVALVIISATCCSAQGGPAAVPDSVGSVISSSVPKSIRQTDAQGRELPFVTKFPDRWSVNNDQTTYEPCTTVDVQTLLHLNLDPGSVADAASANHQTARGCIWKYKGERFAALSQYVGNMNGGVRSLVDYKAKNSRWQWYPDQDIAGRVVGVASIGTDDCATHVQSGGALVATEVGIGSTSDDVSENCRRALAFTRATIDLIPR